MLPAKAIGFHPTRLHLLLHAEDQIHCRRSDAFDGESRDRFVNVFAGDHLTHGLAAVLIFALADVNRKLLAAHLVIGHAHRQSTASAQHDPLQQGRAFARTVSSGLKAVGLGVAFEFLHVLLKLLPAQVTFMSVLDHILPLIGRHPLAVFFTVGSLPSLAEAVDVSPGVARVVQGPHRCEVSQWLPNDDAVPVEVVPRKEQVLFAKLAHRRVGRSGAPKGLEKITNGALNLPVRVQYDAIIIVVDKTHRQREAKLAALGFIEHASAHPRTDKMEFGLTHGAFESEQ